MVDQTRETMEAAEAATSATRDGRGAAEAAGAWVGGLELLSFIVCGVGFHG